MENRKELAAFMVDPQKDDLFDECRRIILRHWLLFTNVLKRGFIIIRLKPAFTMTNSRCSM